jgi:type III secretion system TyeA family effector delivery regulator
MRPIRKPAPAPIVADAFPVVPALRGLWSRLAQKNIMAISFERMAKELGITDDQRMVVFLQGIMAIIRKLPDKAFAEDKGRQKLLAAIQDALDEIIDRLEQAEEAAPAQTE